MKLNGYRFDGWWDQETGGTKYSLSNMTFAKLAPNNGDQKTIYARWTKLNPLTKPVITTVEPNIATKTVNLVINLDPVQVDGNNLLQLSY